MCTSAFIKRHISSLPEGSIFSTRDMLNYGRRSAVDQCLYRLVKIGRIIRLAWGLFIKNDFRKMPSVLQVAREKAKAFGRRIMIEGADAAKLLGFKAFGNERTTYAILGHSSSFRYGNIAVYFKGVCPRKMSLGDDAVGIAVKAMWRLGKEYCQQNSLMPITGRFARHDRLQFKQSFHLMPAWMADIFMRH